VLTKINESAYATSYSPHFRRDLHHIPYQPLNDSHKSHSDQIHHTAITLFISTSGQLV